MSQVKAPAQKYNCSPGDFRDMLGEEGAEVAKERFKMHRFGHHPGGRAPGYNGPCAEDMFYQEIGDFIAVLEHAVSAGVIDWYRIATAVDAKHAKLKEGFGLEQPADMLVLDTRPGRS